MSKKDQRIINVLQDHWLKEPSNVASTGTKVCLLAEIRSWYASRAVGSMGKCTIIGTKQRRNKEKQTTIPFKQSPMLHR
jgi:hypothetical protein